MSVRLPEPIPARIARLPKDSRGYPTPWFNAWFKDGAPCLAGEGEPDFRVMAPHKLMLAYKQSRCWICGDPLGRHRVFLIGPMCVVNRVTSEPPSHRECAEWAARACPFLTKPRMRRLPKDGIPDYFVAGEAIERNPGCVCAYETREYKPKRAGQGYLFQLGAPDRIDWWAEGRAATAEEVRASVDSGYPILMATAKADGPEAVLLLERMRREAEPLLPRCAA